MVSLVESLILPDFFWYVVYIVAPGYLTGMAIAKWRGGSVKIWFNLDSFDKLVISIFFAGIYLLVIDFMKSVVSVIFNIKVSFGIVSLFILATGMAIVFLVIAFAVYSKMTLKAAQRLGTTTDKATQEMARKIRKTLDEMEKPD
ncbi:MAG TPA: hypothetical protein ENH13_06400 [Euryarchaeota archaeon]|nr:hypothetical protein BMS3Abin16_00008 [archaeon BMS3Abin16]HDH28746.1 hypothetical protein [Euryarchaeota archaeon]HDY74275.1 hypothetical protein [Euryarchaeota archaeon]